MDDNVTVMRPDPHRRPRYARMNAPASRVGVLTLLLLVVASLYCLRVDEANTLKHGDLGVRAIKVPTQFSALFVIVLGVDSARFEALPFLRANIETVGTGLRQFEVMIITPQAHPVVRQWAHEAALGQPELLGSATLRPYSVQLVMNESTVKVTECSLDAVECRIARARDAGMQLIDGPAFDDVDFVVPVDSDMCRQWNPHGFFTALSTPGTWAGITANGVGAPHSNEPWRYLDWFAWDQPHSHVRRFKTVFDPEGPPQIVQSAFGGMAIYRRRDIRGCRYDCGPGVCEHKCFHRCIAQRRGTLLMHPRFVIEWQNYPRTESLSDECRSTWRCGLQNCAPPTHLLPPKDDQFPPNRAQPRAYKYVFVIRGDHWVKLRSPIQVQKRWQTTKEHLVQHFMRWAMGYREWFLRAVAGPSYRIMPFHGNFKGTETMASVLTKGIRWEERKKLFNGCDVMLIGDDLDPCRVGGWQERENARDCKRLRPRWWPSRRRRVWLAINAEHQSSEDAWHSFSAWSRPSDHVVILGNWWNNETEGFEGDRVTSIWLPYASLSFAERTQHTPLDLFRRSISQETHGPTRSEQVIAYQQRHCDNRTFGLEREAFWDTLNQNTITEMGIRGTALSICNGRQHLGQRLDNTSHAGTRQGRGRYDRNVRTYRPYDFVVTMEHARSDIGYITEKVADALLAGAIPIYAGATDAQIKAVFATESFLHVHQGHDAQAARRVIELLRDKKSRDEMRRRRAVSPESMRRFFSWHPAVWPLYGDGMRRTILSAVSKHCAS